MRNTSAIIEIRRLSSCSFDQAVKIWNEGFKGYFVDMTLSLDVYLSRLVREGLSPEFSLVAFCDGRPVGFLLNGFRENSGRTIAWNGGTGVSPEFRGRGVGKVLVKATLDLYDEFGVDVAMLEAISTNEPAIALYKQFGYEVVDRLISLRHEGGLPEHLFNREHSKSYVAERVAPHVVGSLEFYEELAPWQTHWQNVSRNQGAALIVSDASGVPVGYALSKKTYDAQGRTTEIALYQCVAKPGVDAEAVVACALENLYSPVELECRRSTYNLSKANDVVWKILEEAGFVVYMEQVHMMRGSLRSE
jgi:ribosomal protein S18 acetylase RimI-like enzyme